MTDYREEQEGEVEALRSIYPEDELKGCNAYLCVPKYTLFLYITVQYCLKIRIVWR